MPTEKRKLSRRNFSYYMRVLDETSGQVIGHLSDISTGGFKLDSSRAIPINMDFRLRVELTNEVANKSFMIFLARSRWCHPDPIDPTSFNVGFQITNMAPSDFEIFSRMFEKYGSQSGQHKKSSNDYLWR
ncbi:MAG: PilZ domain-containing protein [Chloroflexi bacterium]|nr:PilZ domain-containing protein [Chloroflexota bacterium]